MAFPTTLSGIRHRATFCTRPVVSSAGNVYLIAYGSNIPNELVALKATDPATSFSTAATLVLTPPAAGSNNVQCVSAEQVGDVLHVVHLEGQSGATGNSYLRYHKFDMSTDTWTLSNELVKGAYDNGLSGVGAQLLCEVSVRSTGEVVVVYPGAKAASMGSDYRRVSYARRSTGGTWTIDASLDGTVAGATTNYAVIGMVPGASDRAHLFFTVLDGQIYQRCLRSDNSIETSVAWHSASNSSNGNRWSGARVVDGGGATKIVTVATASGTLARALSASMASADSVGTVTYSPNESGTSSITGSDDVLGSASTAPMSVASNATDVWNAYVKSTGGDVYVHSSINQGGTWSSGSLGSDTSINSLRANVFQRGGSLVIGIVGTNDNNLSVYTEYTISAGGTAVGQDLAGSYSIIGAVGQNSAGSYAIQSTVGQDSAGSYAVLNAAGQDQAGTYAVMEAVGANHAGSYGIAGTVSADSAGTYAIHEVVGQDRTGSYAVLSAVGQDQAGGYGVIEAVGQSQAGSYGIVAAVGADGAGAYAVHETVGRDGAGSYAVIASVGQDQADAYSVVEVVGQDSTGTYGIAGTVSADHAGSYAIVEAVGSDLGGGYGVVSAVGDDLAGAWAIHEAVGQSLDGTYAIESTGAVGNDLAGSYGILESVGADAAGAYAIMEVVGQDQGGAYVVVESVGADQAGAYAVVAAVGSDQTGEYGIAQTVGQDQGGAYAVLDSAGADQAGTYAVVSAVGANLSGAYVIDGTATATLYFVSHVTGNVSTPDNALGAADGLFTTDANTATSWTSRWRLDTVTGNNQPSGTQSITLRMRKGSNSGNPTVSSVTLYQGGVSLGALTLSSGDTTISSTTGQDLVYTFDGALLSGVVDVDIEIATAGAPGGGTTRNAASIDAGTWAAAYQPISAVGADHDGSYAIAHAVGEDRTGAYAVIAAVGQDLAGSYAAVEAVGSDSAQAYAVLAAEGADQAGSYAIQSAVGQDLGGAYSIEGQVGVVGQDLAGSYAVAEVVGGDHAGAYAVLQAAGQDQAGDYAVVHAVGEDRAGAYGVAGVVGQDSAGSYGITATVTSDSAGQYQVLATVAVDSAGTYAVLEAAGNDLAQVYALIAQVASDLAGGYAVVGSPTAPVGADLTGGYSVADFSIVEAAATGYYRYNAARVLAGKVRGEGDAVMLAIGMRRRRGR